jgi:hypothetical protein
MALVKYLSEIIQYVIVKNAAELGDASARSALVLARSKTSGLHVAGAGEAAEGHSGFSF